MEVMQHPNEQRETELSIERNELSFNVKAQNPEVLLETVEMYQNKILELTSEIHSSNVEIRNLKEKCSKVVQENENLYKDLMSKERSHGENSFGTLEEWNELNERVILLTQENDLLVKKDDENIIAMNSLREQVLQASKIEQDDVILKQHLNKVLLDFDELYKTKELLEKDLKDCLEDLKERDEDNNILNKELEKQRLLNKDMNATILEYKKTANDLTVAYKNALKEVDDSTSRESFVIEKLKLAEAEQDELIHQLRDANEQVAILTEDQSVLISSLQSAELRHLDMQEKEDSAHKLVQSTIAEMENLKIEKQKLELSEEQLKKDLERMGERVNNMINRNQQNLEMEIQNAKEEFLKEKRKLFEEIHQVEVNNAALQMKLDRAMREKRAAENEHEKILRFIPEEHERLKNIEEELNSRIRRLNRERDDATHKMESAHMKLNQEENKFEKQRQSFTQQIEHLEKRQRKLEKDMEDTKEDQVKIFLQLTEKEQELRNLLEEKKELERNFALELSGTTRKLTSEHKETQHKLLQMKECNEKLTKEIQELLVQQQSMASRWKEESKNASSQFEHIIIDLKERLRQSQIHGQEVGEKYIRVCTLKDEVTQQLSDEKKIQTRLQWMLKNAEAKNASAIKQIQDILTREREVIQEKKELGSRERVVDRLNLEKTRSDRHKTLKDKKILSESIHSLINARDIDLGDEGGEDMESKISLKKETRKKNMSLSLEDLDSILLDEAKENIK